MAVSRWSIGVRARKMASRRVTGGNASPRFAIGLGSKHEEHCRPPLRRPGRRREPPSYSFFLGHGRGTIRPDGRGLSQAVRLSRGPDNRSAIRACHGIAIATVQAGNPITYLCLLPVCEIGYRLGFINTRVWFTDTRVGFTDTRSPSVIGAFVAVSAARRRHNKHGNRQCRQQRTRKRTQHGTSFFAFAKP